MTRSSEVLKYAAGILIAGGVAGMGMAGVHLYNGVQAGFRDMGDTLGQTTTPEEKRAMQIRIDKDFQAGVDSVTVGTGLLVAGGAAAVGHVVFKPRRKPSAYSTGGNYR